MATQDIIQKIFPMIIASDGEGVTAILDEHPGLVFCRGMEEQDRRSPLQLAASEGNLELCRLLVERGAEVYPNPMNQYAPVMEAAFGGHKHVVDYFLDEIPHLTDGTRGLGVSINMAARLGRSDLVRQHLERDPLSVHYRGWISAHATALASEHAPDSVRLLRTAGA